MSARQPPGPPALPAVQRLRVHYAKRGRLSFSSHRDFQRAFERALRRAAVPMAYSSGFSPHPKVSYAGASPTGVASEAEYLEIAVTERCDPARLREALDRSLPPDLDVLEIVEAHGDSLADRLQASVWQILLPGVADETAAAAVQAFLAAERVEVSRLTKNGLRTFDARAAVRRLEVADGAARLDARTCPMCDTSTGRAARHTCRTTRRCPRRTPSDGRLRAAGDPRGHQAGAGAARRAVRHGVRSTGTGPGPRRRLIDDCQHAGHRLRREARRDRDDFRPRERAGTTTVPVRRWTTRVLRETSRPTWPGNMTGD